MSTQKIQHLLHLTESFVEALVQDWIGSTNDNPNFKDTPRRVAESFIELLQGHSDEAREEIQKYIDVTFETKHDEMIVVHGIQGAGVCPHHFLPVLYTIHFAYIPHGKALGLSKVPRIIKLLTNRAEMQEDVTSLIADTFFDNEKLNPRGVAVLVQGFHSCMSVRGIQAHGALTSTSAMRGCFLDNTDSSKLEFFETLKVKGGVAWSS